MDGAGLDGNSAINQRWKSNNFSMAPHMHQRSALAGVNGGALRQGTLSPGNRTGNNQQAFLSHLDAGRTGNDKTGAPVNFVMAPEEEEKEDNLGSPRGEY